MNKNRELIKNTAIIFIGKFCTQFISFLLVPIYTNFLTTSDYGYIDLVQTYITLLVPILILRFDSAIFRFLIDERDNERGKEKIISNILIFLILQVILFSVLFLFFINFIEIKYAYAILINVLFMSISSIFLQMARGIGDNIGYSIASIIAGITTIILNIVFIIMMKFDGSSILVASGLANIICSIFLFTRNKIYKYIKLSFVDMDKFKEILKYSLPMIPDGLSWWIVNVSDRTIISFIINASANGIYAVSSKFSNILSSLFQVFNMSWQESASLHINDEDRDIFFTNTLNTVYKIFYSICILILVSIPVLFSFIIGNDFKSAYLYIPPLLLGNLYNAVANVIGGVYIANKDTKAVARTTMFAALINIIVNLIMIKKFGLYAASISTLLSYVILTIYRYFDVKKYLQMKLNYKTILITTLIFVISTILYYTNNIFINIINIIFAIICCIILNRDIVKMIIKKLGGKNEKNINLWNI